MPQVSSSARFLRQTVDREQANEIWNLAHESATGNCPWTFVSRARSPGSIPVSTGNLTRKNRPSPESGGVGRPGSSVSRSSHGCSRC